MAFTGEGREPPKGPSNSRPAERNGNKARTGSNHGIHQSEKTHRGGYKSMASRSKVTEHTSHESRGPIHKPSKKGSIDNGYSRDQSANRGGRGGLRGRGRGEHRGRGRSRGGGTGANSMAIMKGTKRRLSDQYGGEDENSTNDNSRKRTDTKAENVHSQLRSPEPEIPRSPRAKPSVSPNFTVRSTPIYDFVEQVGEGTYGRVYKARNRDTDRLVALKRLRLSNEKEGMPITAIREIKLLQSLRHKSIVSLREMVVEGNDLSMAFEYLEHDLAGLLQNKALLLSLGNIKNIFKQMMEGLAYLHHKHILHRDIKGSNILINAAGNVKLADFGLARKIYDDNPEAQYTNRVITLWYRPPELLLGATVYDGGIDVWGMGCLLVELYTREAIFRGSDEISQWRKIYDLLGTPSEEEWPQMKKQPWYQLLIPHESTPRLFEAQFESSVPASALKLAARMLEYDPRKRLSSEQVLTESFFVEDPVPKSLDLSNLEEWHDYQAKSRRRKAKRAADELRRRETNNVHNDNKM